MYGDHHIGGGGLAATGAFMTGYTTIGTVLLGMTLLFAGLVMVRIARRAKAHI